MSFAQLSKEVIDCQLTYLSLFSLQTFVAVCPLDIKYQDVTCLIRCHPDSLRCLEVAFFLVLDIKFCAKNNIKNRA
jgi:hypothetical protein